MTAISNARVRLTLWHAGVLAVIVCVFAGATLVFVRARLHAELDAQLARELAIIDRVYREEPLELPDLPADRGFLFFNIAEGGALRHETDGWKQVGLTGGATTPASWVAADGTWFRVQALSTATYTVAAAVDETPARHIVRTLSLALLIGTPFALALAIAGGYVLAGRALAPVNDAFERLERFTADASHELRTPLTVMRSVGEVGLRAPRDPAHYRDVIGSLLEEVDRLTNLVDSLLILTRADAGKIELHRQPADLAELARAVVDQLRVLADEKHQDLVMESDSPAGASFDSNLVRLAASNLVHNAIKFTPEGGLIKIAVRRLPSGEASLEVRDTGPGIPAEHRSRVFDRFYRVTEGRASHVGGAGLGLAIARWAIEANGGTIEIKNVQEGGAFFYVVLPRA